MASSSSSSSLWFLAALFVTALAAFSCVDGAQILGDAAVVLEESDAERWTDISSKKLETQQEAHDEELKVDWHGLDRAPAREQRGIRLNNVHAVHEHPAEVHVAHAQKNVMEVEFRDAADVREISLGGVKKVQESGSTGSVMTVVALGLVAFVVVIGVIRYRASRNGGAGNDAGNGAIGGDDYHWVDELNIIVNPMEEQGSAGGVDEEDQELPLRDDFSEDSELSDREMDLEQGELEELSTEDEDEMPGVTIATAAGVKELRSCRGLEWDDSTI